MSNALNSIDDQSLKKLDVPGIIKIMNDLEAAGNIWGMTNLLAVAISRMDRSGTNEDLQTLSSLQRRVSRAQEREKLAGGHGALIVPSHWINVEIRNDIRNHLDLVPWWDSRVLGSVGCSSANTDTDEKR